MRLVAEDPASGLMVELYPYGKLADIINEIMDPMTTSFKNKEEVTHRVTELEMSPGDKYGLLVIGPKRG